MGEILDVIHSERRAGGGPGTSAGVAEMCGKDLVRGGYALARGRAGEFRGGAELFTERLKRGGMDGCNGWFGSRGNR